MSNIYSLNKRCSDLSLPELARLWFANPLQHAIIVRYIRKQSVGTAKKFEVTTG
ncbi:hypothetical protein D1872_99060 [compost metagenome]